MFLPGESQGRRSLVGCHLWGRTESDTTEATEQQQQQQDTTSILLAIFKVHCHFANDWALRLSSLLYAMTQRIFTLAFLL